MKGDRKMEITVLIYRTIGRDKRMKIFKGWDDLACNLFLERTDNVIFKEIHKIVK